MSASFLKRLVLLGVMVAASAAVLVVGVVPVRDWLDQRSTTEELLAELAEVEVVNAAYRDRIDALNTDEEIERRARAEYNLVRPDEEAYAVLPPPSAHRGITGVWPFAG